MDLDEQVNLLFKNLDTKKKQIAESKKNISRKWVTNQTYRIGTETFVLASASRAALDTIAIDLARQSFFIERGSEILGVPIEDKIQGFSREEWETDLRKRLAHLVISQQEKDLLSLETRINSVMSPEARRAKEIALLMEELS